MKPTSTTQPPPFNDQIMAAFSQVAYNREHVSDASIVVGMRVRVPAWRGLRPATISRHVRTIVRYLYLGLDGKGCRPIARHPNGGYSWTTDPAVWEKERAHYRKLLEDDKARFDAAETMYLRYGLPKLKKKS